MPTSSIPLDTFPLVFRHLSYSRMYAVMLTCRSLHDLGQSYLVTGFDHLVTSDPSDFSERHSQEINRWLRFIISNLHFRAPMTRHISIHTRGKSKDLLYELLPRVLPYAAQLQQLDLPLDFTTPKAGLFDAIGTLSKLQSLSIFLHWEDDMPLFSTMIKTGTLHLHTVNIHSRYLHMILQVLEPIADTLHSLDVQCNELGEAAKSSGLYTFDQVVHFGLDITMKPVLDQWLLRGTFPNLCSLKLGRFDDQTMHPIPSGLQNKLKDQIKDNPQGWRRLRTVSGAIKWISLWQLDHGESNLKHLIVSGMDHEMKSLIRVLRFFEPRVLDLTFTDQPVPCYDDDGPSIHYFEAISVAHHISQPTDQQYHSEALADRRFMWIKSINYQHGLRYIRLIWHTLFRDWASVEVDKIVHGYFCNMASLEYVAVFDASLQSEKLRGWTSIRKTRPDGSQELEISRVSLVDIQRVDEEYFGKGKENDVYERYG